MAFVRPVVLVYQQFQAVTVSPGTPDLNCCLVGPAYYIQDYPTDKTDIYVADFVKAGQTADAACTSDGSSAGLPDPGTDFLTIADPPNHIAGGVLDADSVDIVFDDVYIDLHHGTDGTGDGGPLTADENVFGAATGDFVNKKVAPGDRLIMTNTANPGDLEKTVIKTVKEVTSAGVLKTTSTFKTAEVAKIGTASILWRIEHKLDDQHIDVDAYGIIVGNEITIKTGSTGILLTYESATWTVNYAKIYIGYRELRTDLQDVREIDGADGIESAVGRIDERNPLAAGLQVAFANTGNPIQVFGVGSDDLTGHQGARDKMSTRDDIYAIVPLTAAITKADWVTVINMWKAHCVEFAAYDVAKFRVVLGSYDDLPTEKSSVAPSTTGSTESVATDDIDVFVDPFVSTKFVTNGVSSSHLLDIARSSSSALNTCDAGAHIFSAANYDGALDLLGAIGEKRIRTGTALGIASPGSYQCCYAVRHPILKSEGADPKVSTTNAAATTDAGSVQITKTDAFTSVLAGDVVHLQGSSVGAYNGGWLVKTKTDNSNITLELAYTSDATVTNVDIYLPSASAAAATASGSPNNISSTGAFATVAAGDVLYVLRDTGTPANEGMWIITTKVDNNNVQVAGGSAALAASTTTDFAVFSSTVVANGNTTITGRRRLRRLRDNNASFLTTVETGEDIEIPYPADTDPTKWDTATTQWPIDDILSDEVLEAQLGALEELAPKEFTAGFNGDCAYRVNIDLNPNAQVAELATITESLKSSRCLMTWPNSLYVSNLQNELTEVQNKQTGQYLACAVGGMTAGLPSHQGFTYIGIGGIQQIFNSNFYFTDAQLTDLRNAGWYVFVQDSETSLPYTIHEVTTDVSAYAYGEYMNVKNFDYIALYMKEILQQFLGRYNINNKTIEMIRQSLDSGVKYLQLRVFPKIGAPLNSGNITSVKQHETEVDRVEINMNIDMPKVLNQLGLHLVV